MHSSEDGEGRLELLDSGKRSRNFDFNSAFAAVYSSCLVSAAASDAMRLRNIKKEMVEESMGGI